MQLHSSLHRPNQFRGTRQCAISILLFALISVNVFAGGKQEIQDQNETERERTPIEVQEPEAKEESGTNQETPDTLVDDKGNTILLLDQPAWAIAYHESRQLFQEEVSSIIEKGYIPAGMEVTEEGLFTILYIISSEEHPTQWLVEDYTSETINQQLSERMLSGWQPLAFSVLDESYYVFFSHDEKDIDAWRIHQTPLDTDALQTTIASYRQEGYSLVDMSIDPATDIIWYLFVEEESPKTDADSTLFINAYPNGETVVAGISTDFSEGRGLPVSFAQGSRITLVAFSPDQLPTP